MTKNRETVLACMDINIQRAKEQENKKLLADYEKRREEFSKHCEARDYRPIKDGTFDKLQKAWGLEPQRE